MHLVQKWAPELFVACDPADGVILVDVFVERVLKALPELSPADVEETVENEDGTMKLVHGACL